MSVIASAYDPVGYLQPIVIKLKILFQKICRSKLEWDDDIGILVNKWKEIVTSLTSSETVSFNRCFYPYDMNDPIDKCYLHGFSDASISAFAAVVYFGSISRCGNVAIKFVTSKSRILPLNKSYTIPRLELLGNVILSSLIRVVYNSLHEEIAIEDFFCWTDSFISLSWIRAVNQEFKLFVQNRVIKNRENVNASLWRYCDTKENPADIITRFSSSNNSSENLSNNSIRWDGPLVLEEIKEQYLFTEDKYGNEKHEIYDKIFLGSTKLKIVWIKITTFFKRRVSIIL